jgi:hypothetical protein
MYLFIMKDYITIIIIIRNILICIINLFNDIIFIIIINILCNIMCNITCVIYFFDIVIIISNIK